MSVYDLFKAYDKNKNFRLSAEEIAFAVKKDLKVEMIQDEITALNDYFMAKYKHKQIKVNEFHDLLSTKFERKHDQAEAKKSLQDIKGRLSNLNKPVEQLLMDYNPETTD